MRPVAASSMRSSRMRARRNEDGTSPPAMPLCQPSVITSTRSVASTSPRSEVVSQRVS